ncbi:MAG: aminopeptidase P family protein, partial [Calditrichaeota bacterium]|nr:aminopeptidase P family protein [Calditrichota bacterium]
MIQEKIDQAIGILQEKNIDAWMTFGRETATMRDPMLDFIAGMDFTWQTALIITAKGDAIAIVGQYDVANLETRGNYREIIGYVESIREDLRRVLARLDPRQIAVNYSLSSPTADGLSAGMYMNLQE